VVLFKIRLKGRGTIAACRLIPKGRASTKGHVVVILVHPGPTLLHAQEDKGNAAKQEGTANTAHDAADDVLVGLTQAATTAA